MDSVGLKAHAYLDSSCCPSMALKSLVNLQKIAFLFLACARYRLEIPNKDLTG